jgi:hypothetical protein
MRRSSAYNDGVSYALPYMKEFSFGPQIKNGIIGFFHRGEIPAIKGLPVPGVG